MFQLPFDRISGPGVPRGEGANATAATTRNGGTHRRQAEAFRPPEGTSPTPSFWSHPAGHRWDHLSAARTIFSLKPFPSSGLEFRMNTLFDISQADIRLMAGEMTAQEMRTVQAVLAGLKARAIRLDEEWLWLPKEPTQEMRDAYDRAPGPGTGWWAWKVMTEAALRNGPGPSPNRPSRA